MLGEVGGVGSQPGQPNPVQTAAAFPSTAPLQPEPGHMSVKQLGRSAKGR